MHNILDLLENSARRLPGAVAIADPKTALTFSGLEEIARRIGSAIAEIVPPRSPVPVLCEKSADAVAAFLGAVYAGCFYVPLDARQPADRLRLILGRTDPAILLADAGYETLAAQLDWPSAAVLPIADAAHTQMDGQRLQAIRDNAVDTDPLYATFTSGSTGVPKGVLASHRAVLDFIRSFTEACGITENDVMGNQAPFDFDMTSKDLYSCLLTGARVEILPRSLFSFPARLIDHMQARGVTTLIWSVSATCILSTMDAFAYKVPQAVNKVLFSGEVLPVKHLNYWRRYLPGALYVNLYGPTECTCNCMYYTVDRAFEENETLPLGRPFENERIFLLDENDRPVTQPGELGELCVAGTTLSLGYYNDPERTAESFVQNPLNTLWDETIYRTGDLVRYDERGDLYYVSRKDFQIKHMGRRIELGEIEVALTALAGVSRACCLYFEEAQHIVAFYIGEPDCTALLAGARAALPQYMLPAVCHKLDAMPLNQNGKIDRAALRRLHVESADAN